MIYPTLLNSQYMANLEELSRLLTQRNSIDEEIGVIIRRPALTGHIGEYIDPQVFDIELSDSASEKSIDGHFRSGNRAGKSVNIKYYTAMENLLDITPESMPDYDLVIAAKSVSGDSSKNKVYPVNIGSVYMFESSLLMQSLGQRGVKIETAASVVSHLWESAEVYPNHKNKDFVITRNQVDMLAQFR